MAGTRFRLLEKDQDLSQGIRVHERKVTDIHVSFAASSDVKSYMRYPAIVRTQAGTIWFVCVWDFYVTGFLGLR